MNTPNYKAIYAAIDANAEKCRKLRNAHELLIELRAMEPPSYCNDRLEAFADWFVDNEPAIRDRMEKQNVICGINKVDVTELFDYSRCQWDQQRLMHSASFRARYEEREPVSQYSNIDDVSGLPRQGEI